MAASKPTEPSIDVVPGLWQNRQAVRIRPSLDFSVTGLVFCSMMMFMGLAAMNSQANLLFAIFGLMIGVLLVSYVTSRWVLRNIAIRRVLPEMAQVGRLAQILYEVENRKRFWPTFSLTIAELDVGGAGERFDRQPHAYVLHAAAGMDARVAADMIPLRRGWHDLTRYQLSTSFPFGFIKRAIIRRVPDRMLVYPAMGAVEPQALLRFQSARSSGLNQRPRAGGADELFGAREYRPGDAPRTIHWRRSAQTRALATPDRPHGTLIVKEMSRVAPPRLVVLVDTYVAPGVSGESLGRVEKSIAVAASLLAAAAARGLDVGLVLWRGGSDSESRWLEVRPGRGKRHSRELLTHLAEAPRNDVADLAALVAQGTPLAQGETTGVLITASASGAARGAATTNERSGRGNLVTIPTGGPALDRWVRFDPRLDFDAMAGE